MAYIDAFTTFSSAQALTATANSTNTIDLVNTTSREGDGEPMAVVINVIVAAAGGGTLTVAVQSDDNSSFSSAATVATTAAIAAATLIAGYQFVIMIPPGVSTERYLRLNYTLATMTGITVTARLTPVSMIPSTTPYPDAITIS